ncbi:MAG TPA: hypothetical protein VFK97_02495 [Candidatus Saccharimonadales bacterium]|nr:hypothetical protein [Candidatus Saccharimonadales bacterium]
MKKFWLYLIGVILLGGAAAVIALAVNNTKDDNSKSNPTSDLSVSASDKKACSIFSLADARQILGAGAKGGSNSLESSAQDVAVSQCAYTQSSGTSAPVSSAKTASLTMRIPKTADAERTNASQFSLLKPATAQTVSGYGDSAYWDAEHGQLNILKNQIWYILSYGPAAPSARSLEQTKQLADLLINKM